MKALFSITALLVSITCFGQTINFPSTALKNALLAHGSTITGPNISNIDTNNDNDIQISEANTYSGEINISGWSIAQILGLEHFTNAVTIRCGGNSINSADFSQNVSLKELHCSGVYLNSLIVPPSIQKLYCYNNNLTSIDFSSCDSLKTLICSDNKLSSLDLSNSSKIKTVQAFNNELTSLQLHNNTPLTQLLIENNNFTSLIDLRSQSNLSDFKAGSNNFQTILISNGNNVNFSRFDAYHNPNLSCVEIDNGFNPAGWGVNNTDVWSFDCGFVGLNENFNDKVKTYPNPTSGKLTIETNESVQLIEVYSTAGQKVASFTEKSFSIEAMKKGVYFVKVLSDNGVAVKRIVKE